MRHTKVEDREVFHLIIILYSLSKGYPKREGRQHYPRLPVPVLEGTGL